MRHTGRVVPESRGRCAGQKRVVSVGEQVPGVRRLVRRRRANVEGGRQVAHQVKVSAEEEGVLVRLAEEQHVTVPRLLVESALADTAGTTPSQRRAVMTELFGVHRLLGAISRNVNQLTKMEHVGEKRDDLRATLAAVRRTAERIDAAVDELSLS